MRTTSWDMKPSDQWNAETVFIDRKKSWLDRLPEHWITLVFYQEFDWPEYLRRGSSRTGGIACKTCGYHSKFCGHIRKIEASAGYHVPLVHLNTYFRLVRHVYPFRARHDEQSVIAHIK